MTQISEFCPLLRCQWASLPSGCLQQDPGPPDQALHAAGHLLWSDYLQHMLPGDSGGVMGQEQGIHCSQPLHHECLHGE